MICRFEGGYDMEHKMTFGRLLRMERKRQGLTAQRLGEKMGISGSLVARYERDGQSPNVKTVERFAAALDVPVSCLYPVKSGDPAINFDKWEPCKSCETNSCTTCAYHLYGLGDEPCIKCLRTSRYEPLSFCPDCGRPLTPAARELLERRLRG